MAENRTTRVSKRCPLLCVLLAAFLCAPLLSPGISAEPDQSVQMLALAGPSPTILVNQSGPRGDDCRQRTPVVSSFLLPQLRRPAADRGRSASVVEGLRLQLRCAARTHSGRSPPIAIS